MAYYLVKLLISAAILAAVTEVARVNPTLGGLIKSLPLVSLVAIIWVWAETGNRDTIRQLSFSTFWFVLPTLPFFIVLPLLLKAGWGFWPSLAASLAVMLGGYGAMMGILARLGISL
jgi:hypothetical protein